MYGQVRPRLEFNEVHSNNKKIVIIQMIKYIVKVINGRLKIVIVELFSFIIPSN